MIHFLFIMLMLVAVIGFHRTQAKSSNHKAFYVEIFTTADRELQWELEAETKAAHQNIDLQVYELNRIQRVETALSNKLPINPEQGKQIAQQSIQQLDTQEMIAIQQAAVGLAKAMQYGVDRYPAIVFDVEVVVYGLTDLRAALDLTGQGRRKIGH